MLVAQVPTGNNGWGLTNGYQGTPLDSALALLASSQMGVTATVHTALTYLKGVQLAGTDKGWPVAPEATGDPLTTALVVQSLVKYTSLDSSLSTNITNGLSSLTANVARCPPSISGPGHPAYLKAGATTNAAPLLTNMATSQSSDGSWSGPLCHGGCGPSHGGGHGNGRPEPKPPVTIPDADLRAAINYAMGRNGMDAITQGDMLNLASLSASGYGISDLTGLQYATNLAYLDVRNNNISDFTVLSGLTDLTPSNKLTSGNPGSPAPSIPPEPPGESVPVPGPVIACISLHRHFPDCGSALRIAPAGAYPWPGKTPEIRNRLLYPGWTCGPPLGAGTGRRTDARLEAGAGYGHDAADQGNRPGRACGETDQDRRSTNGRVEEGVENLEGHDNVPSGPPIQAGKSPKSLRARAIRASPPRPFNRSGRSGSNRRRTNCAPPWSRCGRRGASCSKGPRRTPRRRTWP